MQMDDSFTRGYDIATIEGLRADVKSHPISGITKALLYLLSQEIDRIYADSYEAAAAEDVFEGLPELNAEPVQETTEGNVL